MIQEGNKIVEKARELYYEYGIKSITMDDIARETGISKKTLYRYVENKRDLVEKVIDLEIKIRKSEFKKFDRSKLNAIEELFEVKRQINHVIERHSPSMHYDLRKYYPDIFVRLHKNGQKRMLEALMANLKKGKKEGLYRKDINNEIIAKVQLARAENVTESSCISVKDYISGKFFTELFIYHIRGIANSKGLKFLEDNIDQLKIEE